MNPRSEHRATRSEAQINHTLSRREQRQTRRTQRRRTEEKPRPGGREWRRRPPEKTSKTLVVAEERGGRDRVVKLMYSKKIPGGHRRHVVRWPTTHVNVVQ
ncbi:unnamed protein product [Eruca vesicaria subsp. sativa]|uniref:Uncharacterized protein n=1 Tax=Eruca vesicaria subsp. sativa TaxID=29727 RepID=A0ABC8JED6_ERUVS|nr:unnamed protein product [Eruca vesicaria subsp. sativa]